MRHDFSDVTSRSEAERLGRLYPIILREYNPNTKRFMRANGIIYWMFSADLSCASAISAALPCQT